MGKLVILTFFLIPGLFGVNANAELLMIGGSQFRYDSREVKNDTIRNASNDDQFSYIFVKKTCETSVEGVQLAKQLTSQSFNSAAVAILEIDADKIDGNLKRGGLSPLTRLILDSNGLHVALRECFPHSEVARDTYVLSLILADVEGLIGGIGINLIGGGLAIKGIRWVVRRAIWQPLEALLIKSNLSEKAIKYIKRSMIVTAAAGGIGASVSAAKIQAREKIELNQDMSEYSFEDTIKAVEQRLISAEQNEIKSIGSQFEMYWRQERQGQLLKMYSELTYLVSIPQLASERKQYWQQRYQMHADRNAH